MTASGGYLSADEREHSRRRLVMLLAVVIAIGCVGLLAAVYAYFVTSPEGQRIDHSVLQGARIGRGRVLDTALPILNFVSVAMIAAGTIAVLLVAAIRRRLDLAMGAVVLVAGANVTTQIVKHHLLERPDLGVDVGMPNSLPSGHTTVTASLAAAAIVVFPGSLRAIAAAIGAAMTAVIGVSTLAAGWHRPSDVVAALLVVTAWTCLVVVVLSAVGSYEHRVAVPAGREIPGRVVSVVLASIGAVLLVPTALAFVRTRDLGAVASTRGELLTAYAGGAGGIAAASAFAFAIMLAVAATLAQGERRRGQVAVSARAGYSASGTAATADANSVSTFASGV